MGVAFWLLVVSIVAAVFSFQIVIGTNCTESILQNVKISPHDIPVALLTASSKHISNNTFDLRIAVEWEHWAKNRLESRESLLSSIALQEPGSPVRTKIFYGTGHSRGNISSVVYVKAMAHTTAGYTSPLWDCTLRQWLFGFVTKFSHNDTTRGMIVGLFYPLNKIDLNQCDTDLETLFIDSPKCDLMTSKCVSLSGYGLQKGGFRCVCLPGFKPPTMVNFTNVNSPSDWSLKETKIYRCIPLCDDETSCSARPNFLIRVSVITVQLISMVLSIVIGIIICKRRKCKPVAHGMWTILETLIFGIILLYASVIPQSFEPSLFRCIVERWLRELGFIICYGAIILKLYRILMEFRSRKAHRFVIRDKDLLKYLFGMVIITITYLSAWTATSLNFVSEGFSLVTIGQTNYGESFHACKQLWWDYVTQFGEIILLIFGLHLGLAARNATIQFVELRYLLWGISIELVVSFLYYAAFAAIWDTLHPTRLFVATFIRSQLTNTLVLLVIYLPIIIFSQKFVRDVRHHLSHELSDAYKDGIPSDIEIAEVNLADMSHDEIRTELKRLYTQIEMMRNKFMCYNNPHISKRRGGRKVAHRRFSLQKKGSREKQKQKSKSSSHAASTAESEAAVEEVSRTPEDSVCSIEGPSMIFNDGPSTTACCELSSSTPKV